jgi:hypothetical protein
MIIDLDNLKKFNILVDNYPLETIKKMKVLFEN